MFPNPQAALPLPLRPDLVQYKRLAKELVKACKSGEPGAVRAWAESWLESLRSSRTDLFARRAALERVAGEVEEFVQRKLESGTRKFVLADAHFVLARSHGFESWPKFAAHLDALAHSGAEIADFESAADAIVAGDEDQLRRLLRANPALIRARSTREHRGTLLHYVAANGVEGYRQKTPKNAVRIAELLLEAGAEVDAEADMYGGRCTALGLTATSVHPYLAGVQNELMQVLLDHGANINHPDLAGNGHSMIFACLANGRGEAARYLADRGAHLGLVEAAGVGRLDVVKTFFDASGRPSPEITPQILYTSLCHACQYGSEEVVAFLLDHGADQGAPDSDHQTPFHHAAIGGRLGMVKLLLARGAPLEVRNEYGGTVLGQALWSAAHGGDPEVFVPIFETLIAAGAKIPARHPPVNERVDALLARYGSVADPARYWFGEGPRKQ